MNNVFLPTVEEVLDLIISGRTKLAEELLREAKEADRQELGETNVV